MARAIAAVISLFFLLQLGHTAPFHARHATVVERQDLLEEYDFIVIGGGTAGLTVADRLSEEDYTVLVVEYGYLDHSTSITQVGRAPRSGEDIVEEYPAATRMYNGTSTPQEFLDGESKWVPCGAVVGGSSAVNGMLFDRGSAEDYDAMVWATMEDGIEDEEVAREWGWKNILPAFQKSVTFHPPSEEMREKYGMTSDADAAYGGTTPIHSSYAPFQWETTLRVWNAYKAVPGVEFPEEGADGRAVGVFWIPNSIDPSTRTRSYSMLGHYENPNGPASRENYHLLPGHRGTRVILAESENDDESRDWEATSVIITPRDGEIDDDTGPLEVSVAREVVISAGTFHTPQVLQRSGIGPSSVLEAAGVEVKVDLPGVGMNLQDHINWAVSFNFTKNPWPNPTTLSTNETFANESLALWEKDRSGPYSANVNSGAFLPLRVISNKTEEIVAAVLEQDPAAYLPEGTADAIIAGYKAQKDALARQYNSTASATLEALFSGGSSQSIVHIKPLSRGTVMLDPEDDWDGKGDVEPIVDYRALSNPLDADLLVELFKFVRWFYATDAMVEGLGPEETFPGYDVVPFESTENRTVEDAAKEWLRGVVTPTTGHPAGTASIGPKKLGYVIGADLRVHGVEKLSVADNSAMSVVPGTHTSSSAYAIGEKAAELILRRAGNE
ncbi:hypothetical protein AJ79_09473 [Helicocarpus griseus UAMH5409]|uniref:Glucose-methanol-choline oxidoreductase N-terminal domain-containing protein n=1 Tax=Helicocarpus griseus UAMH5409 TaxID=1447875 RepID=A0A2B7WJ18_9EURO|nr:hypothetical protein AJ79_09473 [Helicocarpus griseus UAMH5409]